MIAEEGLRRGHRPYPVWQSPTCCIPAHQWPVYQLHRYGINRLCTIQHDNSENADLCQDKSGPDPESRTDRKV